MDRFFDQWVYGTGFPSVNATWSWREAEKSLRLVIRQTQASEDSGPVFHFPLEVEVATAAGVARHRLSVDSADPVFSIPCAGRPRWVRVDPQHRVLMKLQVEPTRDELLAQLESTSDYFAAADAARGLGRFAGDAAVRRALAAALRQRRFFAAKRAIAAALARLGDEEARDALVAALGERDLRARRGIVRALGEFAGDPVADAALRRSFGTEKSYFVRAEILSAVARIRAPRALDFVARGLAVDSFRDVVRATALRGLAEIEDVRGIELALPWAAPGTSRWARDAAMRALAVLGRLHPAHGRTIQDAIERTLREPYFFAQLSAIGALGSLGRSQALPALRRVETADVDGRLQRAAREASEAIVSGTSLPEPWRALRGQVEQLRIENRDLRSRLAEVEAKVAVRPARTARTAGGRRGEARHTRPRKRSG
jgi:aminopeptidase N